MRGDEVEHGRCARGVDRDHDGRVDPGRTSPLPGAVRILRQGAVGEVAVRVDQAHVERLAGAPQLDTIPRRVADSLCSPAL